MQISPETVTRLFHMSLKGRDDIMFTVQRYHVALGLHEIIIIIKDLYCPRNRAVLTVRDSIS